MIFEPDPAIKHCPWCEHEAPKVVIMAKAPRFQVQCRRMSCVSRAARGDTRELAILYWNQIVRKERQSLNQKTPPRHPEHDWRIVTVAGTDPPVMMNECQACGAIYGAHAYSPPAIVPCVRGPGGIK